jgi:hypothetical protein
VDKTRASVLPYATPDDPKGPPSRWSSRWWVRNIVVGTFVAIAIPAAGWCAWNLLMLATR